MLGVFPSFRHRVLGDPSQKNLFETTKNKKIVAVQATHGKGVGARQRTFAVPRRTAKKM
jgi:hypothetical protein